ncbi:MAG: hypothetical protein Q7V57_06635 [Actinomycetota bacterium]|nr:hypothetical protein [Actinomycetota bacterium]
MSAGTSLPDELLDRLCEAHANVIVERAPDWWALILLACDVVGAGVESSAAAELAGLPATAGRSECEPVLLQMLTDLGLPRVPDHPRVLRHLVADGDIDTVLTMMPLAEIAAAWLRHWSRSSGEKGADDPDQWADDLWRSRAWYEGARPRLELVLELIRQAQNDAELRQIAASCLENCICEDEATLQWVEEEAALSPKFRQALTGVWVYDVLSPASFQRVQRAAGAELSNPRGRPD